MPTPPIAAARPQALQAHGITIDDPYAWLEQRGDPETIAYLEAENAYAAALMAPTAELQERLYAEMRGRIKEEDSSVPLRRGDYLYYTRTRPGGQYPLYCRRLGEDGPEELLIDGDALGAGEPFFRVGPFAPSPDQQRLAYGVDTTGAIVFTIFVKDLRTGELLAEPIPGAATSLEWGEDGRTLYYTRFDQAHRPFQLLRRTLGAGAAQDELVYQEDDERFNVYLHKTRSRAFLLLSLTSHGGSEVHYAPAGDPRAAFRLLDARQPMVEYRVEHQGDRFLIVSNAGAENFRLLAAPVDRPHERVELIGHRPDTLIDGVDAFADHLVVYERRGGLQQIRVSDPDGGRVRYVDFPEPVYSLAPGPNAEYESASLRLSYSSLVMPPSVIDYGLADGSWRVRKQDEIPSGYDPAEYVAERREATAPDGARVPISLVYRRDRPAGPGPLLLLGYGAYGYSYDPGFDQRRISLLDRGFAVAIGHIRGGAELGRAWYEQGRLLSKKNSFSDFIACAERLIADGLTSPDQLAISGTSAGGLLVSAVTNLRPELFRAVLARVPFTNVIAAMLKPELPLTVTEWQQWGDPADPEQFAYMLSYSPYDRLERRAYPHILATAGLNDLQVPYWDPAKWLARLRTLNEADTMLMLRTNMEAGHGGSSGRFSILREIAFEYAFLLRALGLA